MVDVLEPNLADLVTAALAAGRMPRPDRTTFICPSPELAEVGESEGAAERGRA